MLVIYATTPGSAHDDANTAAHRFADADVEAAVLAEADDARRSSLQRILDFVRAQGPGAMEEP